MPTTDAVVLPTNVRPTHYQITLQPDMEKFTFDGLEVIDIDVQEPTSEISLNAAELRVPSGMVIRDGRWIQASSINVDEDNETVTLTFPEPIEPGPPNSTCGLSVNSTTNCGASTAASTSTRKARSATWLRPSSRPPMPVALFPAGTSRPARQLSS